MFILFVALVEINSFGQNVYTLGNSVGFNSWFKLGTLSLDQQGKDAIIRISGGNGYNAMLEQNSETVIHFCTSNGDSNDNGFYGTASYYRTGRGPLLKQYELYR